MSRPDPKPQPDDVPNPPMSMDPDDPRVENPHAHMDDL